MKKIFLIAFLSLFLLEKNNAQLDFKVGVYKLLDEKFSYTIEYFLNSKYSLEIETNWGMELKSSKVSRMRSKFFQPIFVAKKYSGSYEGWFFGAYAGPISENKKRINNFSEFHTQKLGMSYGLYFGQKTFFKNLVIIEVQVGGGFLLLR